MPTRIYAPEQPPKQKVKLRLKNQHLFDQHAHASVPLLEISRTPLYAVYRSQYAELLHLWDCDIQAAEVLKYNGLPDYWQMNNTAMTTSPPALYHTPSGPQTPMDRTPETEVGDPLVSPLKKRPEAQAERDQGIHVYSCCICWQPVERLTFAGLDADMVAHTDCAEGFSFMDDTPGILYDMLQ